MKNSFLIVCLTVCCSSSLLAHQHGEDTAVEAPKVFLDKSPRIVQYQLKRLENRKLLLVERSTDDAKYIPVFEAILTRPGIDRKNREESLGALVILRKTDAVAELITAFKELKPANTEQQRLASDLARMLLSQPVDHLKKHRDEFEATLEYEGFLRQVGFAARILSGDYAKTWHDVTEDRSLQKDWVEAIQYIPEAKQPAELASGITELLIDSGSSAETINACIHAFEYLNLEAGQTFTTLQPFLGKPEFRGAAVQTLLTISVNDIDPAKVAQTAVTDLLDYAQKTPTSERTTDQFLEAMQLAEKLLVNLPQQQARKIRKQIREFAVRVVTIHTVEEEMRYDLPYFAAEAGKPIQILLKNEDLMPHNLVLTTPGALQEVAEAGLQTGPQNGLDGKAYVPHSDKVLQATEMIEAHQQVRLTFNAPDEPGEYPYVCTFPRHWMRMYGVMVVVNDFETWQQNPVAPKDPIGSNRSFVKSWTVEDLSGDLAQNLRGRSDKIGQKIYQEATCLQCHQIHGQGGKVGPELTDVITRWKGDTTGVLREILDPSHKIDDKYAVQMVIDQNGKTATGIVVKEDDDYLYLLDNPEAAEPKKIAQDDILEVIKTPTSMMPKGLLDRFTQDEIYELLAYLQSVAIQK